MLLCQPELSSLLLSPRRGCLPMASSNRQEGSAAADVFGIVSLDPYVDHNHFEA